MGSVHISISKKDTGELIGLTALCKDYSLESYCENSLDEVLQDFEYDLNMGLDLDSNNISSFLMKVEYVIEYLSGLSHDKRINYFDSYNEGIYNYFLERLEDGKKYLENFVKNNNVEDYKIEVA